VLKFRLNHLETAVKAAVDLIFAVYEQIILEFSKQGEIAMKTFRFLALALLGFILITGCDQAELPTASEETLGESAKFSPKKSGPGTIAPGVVHWWPGDGNANDIIGGRDGLLMDDATFADGQVGQAFSFDGDFDFVSVPGTFGGGTEATVEAWVKTEGITGDFQAIIIGPSTGDDFVHLQLHHGGNNVVFVNTAFPWWIDLPIISPEPTGVFRHIAISIKSGETILYVNGDEVGRSDKTFPSITTGEIKIGGGGTLGRWFKGLIDEVRIFNRALSASEIQAIVKAGRNGNKPNIMVEICHKPGTPAEKTLVVPYHALAGHLGHGDTIGACE